MTLVFQATDQQFAVSTGSNVDAYGDSSIFDYPPNGSKDLIISVNDGDTDPRLFELGDTYDISWGGQGGGGTIEDAVVIRSDAAPGSGEPGIIVFEGTDENGDPAQVIWTPEFDLEGWYWDNYNPSAEPGFFTYDTDPAYTHEFICFAAEAHIATPSGPVPAGRIRAGETILTRDRGAQTVKWVGKRRLSGQGSSAPVVFEPGAFGNTQRLRLSQHHCVLVVSQIAELWFGAFEVLAPAKGLVDQHAVRIEPCSGVTYIHFLLDRHELIRAEDMLCESLLHGPVARPLIEAADPDRQIVRSLAPGGHCRTVRPVLSVRETRLLTCLGGAVAPISVPQPRAVSRPGPQRKTPAEAGVFL